MSLTPRSTAWQVAGPELAFEEIARQLAPILWFSPDEPLLCSSCVVPSPIPCDQEDQTPIVYYNIAEVYKRGMPTTSGNNLLLRNVQRIVVKFHLYFHTEEGLNAHDHDLETVAFHIDVEPWLDRSAHKFQLSVRRVVAEAHNLANILTLQGPFGHMRAAARDTKLPLTLLIEEGKHGICPDRNADGLYTPGYDVNENVADAWGLRDVFGSGLLTRAFDASQAKSRRTSDNVTAPGPSQGSDEGDGTAGTAPAKGCTREYRLALRNHPHQTGYSGPAEWPAGFYDLRSAHETRPCPKASRLPCAGVDQPRALDLGKRMEQLGFGRRPREKKPQGFLGWLLFNDGVALSLNYDQGPGLAATFLLPTPLIQHVALRDTVTSDSLSVDALFSPSTARWLDWYAGFGFSRRLSDRVLPEGPAVEAGIHLRFSRFGARLGARSHLDVNLARRTAGLLSNSRVVLEVSVVLRRVSLAPP